MGKKLWELAGSTIGSTSGSSVRPLVHRFDHWFTGSTASSIKNGFFHLNGPVLWLIDGPAGPVRFLKHWVLASCAYTKIKMKIEIISAQYIL